MAVNPFDYIKAINEKRDIEHTFNYNPYPSNIAFSLSLDTVMLAQEMNQYPRLSPRMQFDFMNGAVRKGKRYNKWHKEEEIPHLEAVTKYFGYSKRKAIEALEVLTQENIRDIIQSQDIGGR